MTVEEHWQAVEAVLNASRETPRSDERELGGHVDMLMAVPEGRERLLQKLGSGKFKKRALLVREVARVCLTPTGTAAEQPPSERGRLAKLVLDKTFPSEDAHWQLLSYLCQTGHIQAGPKVEETLKKCGRAKDELSVVLRECPWVNLPRDQGIAVLEAAKNKTRNTELRERIEKAIAVLDTKRSVPTLTAAGSGKTSTTASTVSPPPTSGSLQPGTQLASPSISPVKQAAGDDQTSAGTAPSLLDRCLGDVTRLLSDYFQQQDKRLRASEVALSQQRDEFEAIRTANREQLEELAKLRQQLQESRELSERQVSQVLDLEASVARLTDELNVSRLRCEELAREANAARHEARDMERRTSDYVHQADLEKDTAVRTFQARLWTQLRMCLAEVLEGDVSFDNLQPEQVLILRRLQEIKDVLRENGVAPQ